MPKAKPTPWQRPAIFDDYTFFNGLTIFGYTYSFDTPLGFSLGAFGVYTSLGFAVPNLGDYPRAGSVDSGTTDHYYLYPPNYNSSPILDRRDEIIDWVIGYNITIIPNTLYLPIGVGMEATRELRLQKLLYDNKTEWDFSPEWNPNSQWETSFLFEVGLLFRVKTSVNFAPYLFGTYRNIGINKHSFSIGIGGCFDFLADK